MFKKILVAIDGSEPSKHAINYAMESASKWNAEMVVLTVVPPISSFVYGVEGSEGVNLKEYENAVKRSFQRVLTDAEKMVKEALPGLKISAVLAKGHVPTKIVEIADDLDVDLIVMGSRGLSGVKSWFLGSVSKHVAEHCKKPILIIK